MQSLAGSGLSGRVARLADEFRGQNALARASGLSPASINGLINGDSDPRMSTLFAIANAAGRSVSWLLTGEGDDADEGLPLTAWEIVPRLREAASAGPGTIVDTADVEGPPIALSKRFMRELGLQPGFVFVTRAAGNSMFPAIRDGDMVIVSTVPGPIVDLAIHAFAYGQAITIKRARFQRDGSLILSSDNGPALNLVDEVVPADDLDSLTRLGRVVYPRG